MKIGSVVALPSGFIAKVTAVLGDTAECEYLGYPVKLQHKLSELRYLGPERPPISPDEIDLGQLIEERNQEALEFMLKKQKGGKKKELSLLDRMVLVKDDQEQLKQLLKEQNLLKGDT